MTIDRPFFFANVRQSLFGGQLSQSQVDGMGAILNGWDAKFPNGDLRWLAYMLATTFHETNRQMTPVREAYWLSEEWRKKNLPYYPYYGRGYVQLTHASNYAHAGQVLGVNMVAQPDLALRLDFAAVIIFAGMTEGWFRADPQGRRYTLPRFFNPSLNDPIGARKIINGFEPGVAEAIAGYHNRFGSAFRLVPARTATPAVAWSSLTFEGADLAAEAAPVPQPFVEVFDGGEQLRQETRPESFELHRITADIVLGYIAKNAVSQPELPD